MALTDKLGTADSAPGNLTVGQGAPELVVPVVRVSQITVERLVSEPVMARISQFMPELLILAPSMARVSQFTPEILISNPLGPAGGTLEGPWIGDGGGGSIWIE